MAKKMITNPATLDSSTFVYTIWFTWSNFTYVSEYLSRWFQTIEKFLQIYQETTVEESWRIKIMYTNIEFRELQFERWKLKNNCEIDISINKNLSFQKNYFSDKCSDILFEHKKKESSDISFY